MRLRRPFIDEQNKFPKKREECPSIHITVTDGYINSTSVSRIYIITSECDELCMQSVKCSDYLPLNLHTHMYAIVVFSIAADG